MLDGTKTRVGVISGRVRYIQLFLCITINGVLQVQVGVHILSIVHSEYMLYKDRVIKVQYHGDRYVQ